MKNPNYSQMAEQVRSRGRGPDTMLVHMTPQEVGGLQQLALASGGSLTVNPDTGLPEAGWLGRLLPTLFGIAGAAFGLPTWAIGLGAGAAGTAATGDLGKGLIAGLGAMGGAGIGNAVGLGGAISQNALGLAGTQGAASAAAGAAGAAGTGLPAGVAQGALPTAATAPAGALGSVAAPGGQLALAAPGLPGAAAAGLPAGVAQGSLAAATPLPTAVPLPEVANAPGFIDRFRAATDLGMEGLPGTALSAASGYAAIAPLLTPDYAGLKEEEEEYVVPRYGTRRLAPRLDPRFPQGEINFFDNNPAVRLAEGDSVQPRGLGQYISMFNTSPGPITASLNYPGGGPSAEIRRSAMSQPVSPTAPPAGILPSRPGEIMYDIGRGSPTNPNTLSGGFNGDLGSLAPFLIEQFRSREASMSPQPMAFATGGEVQMQSGGFVMPARETAEFGNGDTAAGQRRLAALGGMPIRGKGDGVSDSIPARIDGQHPARLASGETYFPPEAVKRLGGASRLRAMMNAATESRKRAERGGEHKIRGLA
jgi:hypothetical protein